MSTARVSTALVLVAFSGACAGACAKGPLAVAAAKAAPAVVGGASNACVKNLNPRDLSGILGASGVTVAEVANNAQACRFEGADGAAVVIGLRYGDEVAPFWKLAVDASGGAMIPLPGVGEAALRKPDGSEVIARQGALSCQAELIGPPGRLRMARGADGGALAASLAALCDKVFAARRA